MFIGLYNNGQLTTTIVAETENDGLFVWEKVPWFLPPGSQYSVGIRWLNPQGVVVYSKKFVITAGEFSILQPANGSAWLNNATEVHQVIWETALVKGNADVILYNDDSKKQWAVCTQVPNNGSCAFVLPQEATDPGENYYISVTASATGKKVESDYFAIVGELSVLQPQAGTRVPRGTTIFIEWQTGEPIDIGTVGIQLWLADEEQFDQPIQTENDGFFEWAVDVTLAAADNYSITVTRLQPPVFTATSDYFSIVAGPFRVVSPAEDDHIYQLDPYLVTWESENLVQETVNIELWDTENKTKVADLAKGVPNNGSMNLAFPHTLEPDAYHLHLVTSTSAKVASSGLFDLLGPLVVKQPNATSVWYRNDEVVITWESGDALDETKLSITLVHGDYELVITDETENDGLYMWSAIPPDVPPSLNYTIRLDVEDPVVSVSSDEFEIKCGSFSVVEPEEQEGWYFSERHTVVWNTGCTNGTLSIHLISVDTAADYAVASAVPNNGSYSVLLPAAAGYGTFVIRLQSLSDVSLKATSAPFRLVTCLEVTTPDNTTLWQLNTFGLIEWDNGDPSIQGHVLIELVRGGSTFLVVNNTENKGAYIWKVPPNAPIGVWQVRISSWDFIQSVGVSQPFVVGRIPAREKHSDGAIIGICVGCAVAAMIFGGALMRFYTKKESQWAKESKAYVPLTLGAGGYQPPAANATGAAAPLMAAGTTTTAQV